jgi:predicted transposase YdaD
MHEYDTVLKALLQSPQNTIFEKITGTRIERWLPVEFPEVQQTRVDLLGVAAEAGHLIGLELQSSNDVNLPLRMAEYALRIYRLHKTFAKQYVLYVGNQPLRMGSALVGPDFFCRFTMIDVRELDEASLLDSPFSSDSILAILTKNGDRRATIQRILQRVATLETGRRDDALKKLMILAGLRELEDSIRAEVKNMPILNDIMEHKVFGPLIRQGRQEGRLEGELNILRRLLAKRFGTLSAGIEERLSKLSTTEMEELSVRVFDAKTIDELFDI